LMAVTNAISGLTAVGGLLLLNKASDTQAMTLAIIGSAVSCVNIFGGFVVSKRMLGLFKRKEDKDFSMLWLLPGILFIALVFLVSRDIGALQTICGLMCIVAIGGLASMKTANAGCTIGISAVAAAMISTVFEMNPHRKRLLLSALALEWLPGFTLALEWIPSNFPRQSQHSTPWWAWLLWSLRSETLQKPRRQALPWKISLVSSAL